MESVVTGSKVKLSARSEAVKKSSKVVFTLPRDETRERLVHHHSTSTGIATFETVSIQRTCFVTVTDGHVGITRSLMTSAPVMAIDL